MNNNGYMYKVAMYLSDNRKVYLGEHLVKGDPWHGIAQVADDHASGIHVLECSGWREDMPGYCEIADLETYNKVTEWDRR